MENEDIKLEEKENARKILLSKLANEEPNAPADYIADAIQEYLKSVNKKMPRKYAEQFGEMLLEIFGYSILKESQTLCEKFKKDAEEYYEKYVNIRGDYMTYSNEVERLEDTYDYLTEKYQKESARIKDEIENLRTIEESDPRLRGAILAFEFVLSNTGDRTLASKALNSYLIGAANEVKQPVNPYIIKLATTLIGKR